MLIYFYVTTAKDRIQEVIDLIKKDTLHFDLDFGLRLFSQHKIPEG
jgi:hypothetical protein